MADMERLIRMASEAGFERAAALDPSTIALRDDVRAMCASNRCAAYGRNWACPPYCGDLEALRERIARYRTGLLVQTVAALEDEFDGEGMMATEREHKRRFTALHARLHPEWPGLMAMGAGACTRCAVCSCPDAPCRCPDERVSSMEAYGILVLEVCRANGMGYYYGPGTIAFTSGFLLE